MLRPNRALGASLIAGLACASALASASPPEPRINPLGSLAKVERVRYEPSEDATLRARRDDGKSFARRVAGRSWSMWVPTGLSREENRDQLLAHVERLGGRRVFEGSPYEVFSCPDPDGKHTWWAMARFVPRSYELRVYQARRVAIDEAVSATLARGQQETLGFEFTHPGGRFLSAVLEAPAGNVRLSMERQASFGAYSRKVSYQRSFEHRGPTTRHLDDLPQDAGTYFVELSGIHNRSPVTATLRFVLADPIAAIQEGEALGGVLVRGASYGSVTAEPEGDVRIEHPEFGPASLRADVTPGGEASLLLPAGFWKLRVSPVGFPGMTGLETRMVPVHSGRQTTVDWPRGLGSVFGAGGKAGVRITGLEARPGEAVLDFQLQGEGLEGVTPTLADLEVLDGGNPGIPRRLEARDLPPDVVLLIDSSGSMKGQMRAALDAARRFLGQLPADSHVRVVDFDTTVKTLQGETPTAVLPGLAKVTSRGATALYDSVLVGLKLLRGKRRPHLVLFTDGVDANWNDTAPGSKASKDEVLDATREAGVPVFTIGFGQGHDRDTLSRLASVSGGQYFPAADEQALASVFSRIREDLGRAYRLTYQRPTRAAPSDAPVVHVVIDTSGSMGSTVDDAVGLTRLESVKEILRRFVGRLPEGTMTALQTYAASSGMAQVLTRRGYELRRTLGVMRAGSDTELVEATEAGLRALTSVPSTDRTFLFFTDAAIRLPRGPRQTFHTLLGQMKDQGIRSLWVGVGIDDAKVREASEAPFREAAEVSGGAFLVSEDPAAVQAAVDALAASITAAQPAATQETSVRLSLRQRLASGRVVQFTGTRRGDLPPLEVGDRVAAPEAVSFQVGPLPPRYDPEVAARVGGASRPGRDLVVSRRLALDVAGEGAGLEVRVPEALVLSRLRGIEPPEDSRFLALPLALTNPGTASVRLDPRRRLFLRQNGDPQLLPVSAATWLTEQPLYTAARPTIAVGPGEEEVGTVVFQVRDEALRQLSLHLLADPPGAGLDLALLGEGGTIPPRAAGPPDAETRALAPGLTAELLGTQDHSSLAGFEAGEGARLRELTMDLFVARRSRLALDPDTSFTLAMPTPLGEVVATPHGVTSRRPFGLQRSTLLEPEVANRAALCFRLPAGLPAASPGVLLTSVGETRAAWPLGDDPGAPERAAAAVRVHAAERVGRRDAHLLVDLSVVDAADGQATSLAPGWRLSLPQAKEAAVGVDRAFTGARPFGWDGVTLVHDGRTRRGLLAFPLPRDWEDAASFRLHPPPPVDAPIEVSVSGALPPWLRGEGRSLEPGHRGKDRAEFRRALARAARARAGSRRSGDLDSAPEIGAPPDAPRPVPVPDGNLPGLRELQRWVQGGLPLMSFQMRAEALSYVPRPGAPWAYLQEPAAMLTQRWGTAGDFGRLAEVFLARNGFVTRREAVRVTSPGLEQLAERSGVEHPRDLQLPALAYRDREGRERVLVAPFMQHVDEIQDWIAGAPEVPDLEGPGEVRVRLEVLGFPEGEARARALGGMSAALKGKGRKGKPERVEVMDRTFTLPAMGRAPVDLAYSLQDRGQGPEVVALLETPDGLLEHPRGVPAEGFRPTEEVLEVTVDGRRYEQRRPLASTEDLLGTFRTLGVNLPDVPETGLEQLETAWRQARRGAGRGDDLSAVTWLTRGILTRFVAAQTRVERQAALALGLVTGRTRRPRVLVARVVARPDASAEVSLDLLQAANDLHFGSDEARRAFRIGAGLATAQAEGAAVPGGGGLFDAWRKLPAGATLHWISPRMRKDAAAALRAGGAPEALAERVAKGRDTAFLLPSHPVDHAGKARWAWLEVDTESYETVARFDTGERGSMIEFSIGNWAAEAQAYLAGALVGISASMWSVSAFSLEIQDQAEMLSRAKAFALAVSDHFSVGASVSGGGVSASAGMGLGSEPAVSASDGVLSASWSGGKISVGQDLLGFGNGYAAGVEYYFSRMR